MDANIKPCRVVWEMTCKCFSLLLYGRNCAKSSRCWPASFQSRFTMDIGTVLKGIMCVSVWTRVKTTWREKWRWIFSKEMYVFSILLQFSWNSVGAWNCLLNSVKITLTVKVVNLWGILATCTTHIRTLPPKRTSGNECLGIIFVHFALL